MTDKREIKREREGGSKRERGSKRVGEIDREA